MIFYHTTHSSCLEKILKDGLICNANQDLGFTQHFGKFATIYYGVQPIYLSKIPWGYKELQGGELKDYRLLKIDASNLNLTADLPTFVWDDFAELANGKIFWEDVDVPDILLKYLDADQTISIATLLNTAKDDCITYTKTAACLENISPKRISIVTDNELTQLVAQLGQAEKITAG